MKTSITTHIALGSNQGDRLLFLNKAIHLIVKHIGELVQVSKVYKTPAMGFEGNDFLNACIAVNTRLGAEASLEQLLKIEKDLGRQRHGTAYENRPIDLDIIFYDDQIISSKKLTVPHSQMAKRNFVLYPLADIAAEVIHPQLKKTVDELKKEAPTDPLIEVIPDELKPPVSSFEGINYLTIEGNIGAGKTSLATMIAQDFNAKLSTERYKDNPFLPGFYKNPARYAFPLEMSFLADRYQQLLDDIGQFDLFSNFLVTDYDAYKSLIFAKVTLHEEEYRLYRKVFDIMYKDWVQPDLYVYLYQSTERLLENIEKRGRNYEQEISTDYLEKINKGYLEFIKNQHDLHVKIIDISLLDFVENREDYLVILSEIQS